MGASPGRQVLSLDEGWWFHLGDVVSPVPNTHIGAYMANKAGWSRGAAKVDYDDSDWRSVDLPHDWAMEGKFDPANHVDAGFLPRGIGWYRRYFRLEGSQRGRYLALKFDGVATHCTVYFNGHLVHRHFCGYTPFVIDISDIANFGEQLNVIAVRVDATYMEGWWYEGAGIYRHVWLIDTGRPHVAMDGVYVHPRKVNQRNWEVTIETEVVGGHEYEAQHEVVGPSGEILARLSGPAVTQSFRATDPQLWSLEERNLYEVRTRILCRGQIVDAVNTKFGFRTIRFDANDGFFLNDKPLKLKGTCNHQDHAGVGVAVPDSIHRFRIARLLEMGSNAYRCAHNPPATELLDACDELGMLVMDENRNFGSSPEHLSQLAAMVRRDRNHPSVILWSICNEEAIQGTPVAGNIARAMVQEVKRLDPSRPVTAAVSGGLLNDDGIVQALDVVGINYQLNMYDAFHAKYPNAPVLAAETHSTFATRGAKRSDRDKCVMAGDGREAAPWGASAQAMWDAVSSRPFMAGLFAWTGFDYRGEPTPFEWPCVSSFFGLMDTCGFEKELFYTHQNWWGPKGGAKRIAWSEEPAVALGLEVHPSAACQSVPADGAFVLPITIFAVDACGQRVGSANHLVTLSIEGPGKIVGVGNGDPTCHEPDKAMERSLFNGLAQVLVQTTKEPGQIVLTASSVHLNSAKLSLVTSSVPSRPTLPPAPVRRYVRHWHMSPVSAVRPDVYENMLKQDMNSWERIDPANGAQSAWNGRSGFAIYRASFTPPKSIQERGGQLVFHEIVGAAEIYIDGHSVAFKADSSPGPLTVPLSRSSTKLMLSVLLQAHSAPAGITQPVELIAAACAKS